MSFTVNDYQDLVQLLRQRPEWQTELRHLLLDDDFLALPRIVGELGEANREANVRLTRLEQSVQELVEAQRAADARLTRLEQTVQELVEAQRQTEFQIKELAKAQRYTEKKVAKLEGLALERKYIDKLYSYVGRWMQGLRVVLPGAMDGATERQLRENLTDQELDEVFRLDILARGKIYKPTALADQEVWLCFEVSVTVDRDDVKRARRRAGLVQKAGLRAVPIVAGEDLTEGADEAIQAAPIVTLQNGHATGWDETVMALQKEK